MGLGEVYLSRFIMAITAATISTTLIPVVCKDVALLFKSFFVWPLTCILFAQQHYALRHLAACSCGTEATGVKWFGCTVDRWDSTDSQFTLFPLDYEDQVPRMWEHCGNVLGSGGACHCKPGGVHLGPRLIPFCCGILIKLLCPLDFRLVPWKVIKMDKESLSCTPLLLSLLGSEETRWECRRMHLPLPSQYRAEI